jgi:hypothetical protein
MKVEELAPTTMPGGNLDQHPQRTRQINAAISADKTATIDPEIIKTPSQDRIRFNKLEAEKSQAQLIAQQIRQVNESMETIDSHLSDMRAELEHVVKIYPPYPPDSTERIEALRQFSVLRKMIDQITRSVGDDSMANVASVAAVPTGGADQETAGEKNKLYLSRQSLHPGQDGLDIPDIPINASDDQISDALDRTIAAQATLQKRRRSFIAEANRIISELS